MNTLAQFERMAAIAAEMAGAAEINDWDRLAELERKVAAIRAALLVENPMGRESAELAEADALRRAELIQQTLTSFATVKQHTKPWLESVRTMLAGAVKDQNVRKAYGAFEP